MTVQIHCFRTGVPHAVDRVFDTPCFPVSGLVVASDDTPNLDAYVRTRAQELAHDILQLIAIVPTARYARTVATLSLEPEDRERTGRAHMVVLPDTPHTNPAALCPACTTGILLEHNDDMRALSAHVEMVAAYATQFDGHSVAPEELGELEWGLNCQFHGLTP